METLLVFHDVDDVDHWLASPKREELFGPLGMTARTFRDPAGSNRVALLVEVPDVAAWEAALQTPEAAEAMKFDGVRPETILGFVEA
jgi:hypothetical protein